MRRVRVCGVRSHTTQVTVSHSHDNNMLKPNKETTS